MTDARKETAIIPYALLALYALLILRNAWISDDAIITFRAVENFLSGYGPGYNPFVRVQAFTHPLWMSLIALVYFIGGLFLPSLPNALFYATFFLSIAFSVLTVFILLTRVSRPDVLSLSLAALPLSLSNGFIDFSTSGLENPLTHFLLIVFIASFLSGKSNPARLALISSLILLNRMDAFLMTAPALLYVLWASNERKKTLGQMFAGFLPFLAWEIFSLFYFGFLFPNTAYAKLNTGVPHSALILQGLDYFLNALNWDAVTLFGILLAGLSLYASPDRKRLFLFIGVALYLLYIVWIGGDFFAGRFLSAPLLASTAIVSGHLEGRQAQGVALTVVVLFGAFSIRSPLWSSNMVAYLPAYPISDRNAISDQRLEYFGNERKGQFNSFAENGFREFEWGSPFAGNQWRFTGFEEVYVAEALGKPAYKKGPNTYVIDYYALSDPLLARLPASEWEIGHFRRDLPEGYLETLQTGGNKITDPNLSRYYDKLNYIISGPLWNWDRIVEIWRFNAGQYDPLLEKYLESVSH